MIDANYDQANAVSMQILLLIDEIKNKFKSSDKLNQIIQIIKEDNQHETIDQLSDIRIRYWNCLMAYKKRNYCDK